MTFTENEFIKIAEDALEQIPLQLRQAIQNVAIVLEEEPPPERPGILGLYQGVPLTERSSAWDSGAIPDTISIYRGPLTRMCSTPAQLKHEITVTVIHEVAHHFGIDDDRLTELGWG